MSLSLDIVAIVRLHGTTLAAITTVQGNIFDSRSDTSYLNQCFFTPGNPLRVHGTNHTGLTQPT